MGKKHGGLNQVGKVKSQTPEVSKNDKPKKPTGRALKRAQYNKRFIANGDIPNTKNPNKQSL